jgi:GT2 family glycosyltransferase
VDVSVCIANWNCREVLRACLASLRDSSAGVRLETIVVDNGSHDGAAAMVAAEFPEVILLQNAHNLGFAPANNQAARRARGRYLFFLNNDTVVPPGALRQLVAYANAHPEVGMIGPRLRDGQGCVQVSYRPRPTVRTFLHRYGGLRWTGLLRGDYRRYRRQDFDPDTVREVDVLMGAAVLLPRDVFFRCGCWDEAFFFGGEDLDLCLRVSRRYPLVYYPRVEILHHGRMSTRLRIGGTSSHVAAGFVRYFRKAGCPETALLLYKLGVTLDTPLQVFTKSLQYGWRRLTGRRGKAEKSRLVVCGLGHFLFRGLVAFWRA